MDAFSASAMEYVFRGQAQFLPYPLDALALIDADEYKDDLVEPVWHADVAPINGTWLCCEWMEGAEIRRLEGTLPQLSAGMLRELHRNLGWLLQGLASIAIAACDKRVPSSSRPGALRVGDETLDALGKLPRAIRRLSFRVSEGLPDDVLWMTGLCPPGAPFHLSREEILALRADGLGTPQSLMLSTKEAGATRAKAFAKTKPDPLIKANWIRDACRDWKATQRARAAARQVKRAKRCARVDLVARFYQATGTDFERLFEEVLGFLKLPFDKLDDKTKTGAPDYLLRLVNSPPLVVELKSREAKLIDYNKAVEVLAASEIHGHKGAFCVTLCHPGVDPSVPAVVASCGRLCVVESIDFGEALLRYCEGVINDEQLYQWLATPGQALAADLPFREYG
jgi:helicase